MAPKTRKAKKGKGLAAEMAGEPPRNTEVEPEAVDPKEEAKAPALEPEVLPPEPSTEQAASAFDAPPAFAAPASDPQPAPGADAPPHTGSTADPGRAVEPEIVDGPDEREGGAEGGDQPKKRKPRKGEAPHSHDEYKKHAISMVEFGDACARGLTDFALEEHAKKGRIPKEEYQRLSQEKINDNQKDMIATPLAHDMEARMAEISYSEQIIFAIGAVYLPRAFDVLRLKREGDEVKEKEEEAKRAEAKRNRPRAEAAKADGSGS